VNRFVDYQANKTLFALEGLKNVRHGPRMFLADGATAETTGRISRQIANPAVHVTLMVPKPKRVTGWSGAMTPD
jgi:hypothetical protein